MGIGNPDIKNHGALTKWTQYNQPNPALKKAGWAKRKRSRELVQALLEQEHIGDPLLKAQCAIYFNCSPDEVTNELMVIGTQVFKAIQDGDIEAARLVLERAYGRPTEDITLRPGVNVAQVIIQEVKPESLEILESDEDGATIQ
jgi:AraC-like DNA-binding protein